MAWGISFFLGLPTGVIRDILKGFVFLIDLNRPPSAVFSAPHFLNILITKVDVFFTLNIVCVLKKWPILLNIFQFVPRIATILIGPLRGLVSEADRSNPCLPSPLGEVVAEEILLNFNRIEEVWFLL